MQGNLKKITFKFLLQIIISINYFFMMITIRTMTCLLMFFLHCIIYFSYKNIMIICQEGYCCITIIFVENLNSTLYHFTLKSQKTNLLLIYLTNTDFSHDYYCSNYYFFSQIKITHFQIKY